MLYKRFRFLLPVLALMLVPATDGFAQTTVSSGKTVQSSTLTTDAAWPVTVESGGTLHINSNPGTSSQTLTISGTGNGTVSETDTTPLGALYSTMSTSACGMSLGIKATVNISGTASTTVTNGNRLRFQGSVTDGTLTTYSLSGGETHAGYYSSFNIEKLVIAKGNFTFNAQSAEGERATPEHIFSNGIEVQNGGIMRLWSCSKGISFYSDQAKTQLATVTLETGSAFKVESENAKIKANLKAEGNSSLNLTTNLEWQAGSITGTGTLTMSGSKLTMDSGTSISVPLNITSGTLEMNSGSSFNGTLTYGSDLTKININIYKGVTATLNGDTTLNSSLKTLSGDLKIAANKTVTVNGVDTSANETKGTITLNEGSTLKVKSNSTSKFNADVTLAGNATIMLDATSQSEKGLSNLTVKTINASGKTLTFAKTTAPGGTLTADSVTANKLLMSNSSNLTIENLTAGTIEFYRENHFSIANTLTLGGGGVSKSFNDSSVHCSFTFNAGATVKLLDSATNCTILSKYGDYYVNLNGTLNVNLNDGQTLTWQNSNFKGTAGTTNKIVKAGDGTLNLIPTGSSNLAEVQLNDGRTNLSGTLTATKVTLAEDASFSPGASSNAIGKAKITGALDANGTINLEFNNSGNDALEITGTADFADSEILLNWLGEEIPQPNKTYTFLKAGTLTGLDLDSITISENVAQYFNPLSLTGRTLTLSVNNNAVPEPATWLLLLLGLVVGRSLLRR